jgi:glycosyltransferase involved in cell wall biosynthesis
MSRIVLSGVNLTGMGGLSCFREALASLARFSNQQDEVIAIVHKAELLGVPSVQYVEYPRVKTSWMRRIKFEYLDLWRISRQINADLWISMHDMSPRVRAKCQMVYCHNPAPFHRLRLREVAYDWKFGLFAFLYRFLYRINIRRNAVVIVQQEWLRDEFKRRYKLRGVVVAHPAIEKEGVCVPEIPRVNGRPYRFFYPAYPRVFKNFEVILDAARLLREKGVRNFELAMTLGKDTNRFANHIYRTYSDIREVRWLGLVSRDEVLRRYEQTDCLLFPSRLETWGLPITEFRPSGKPILAADLPYAHETVGNYARAAFFNPSDAKQLASMMEGAIDGTSVFGKVEAKPITEPFAASWEELWGLLLKENLQRE